MSCPNCFRGGVTTEQPRGTETTLHGLPAYVAKPDEDITPKGVIVMVPDAFGWEFVNNRVLCDHYAKTGGFLVYLPDFMDGGAMSPSVIPLMDHVVDPAPTWLSAFSKPLSVLQLIPRAAPFMVNCRPSATYTRVLSFIQAIRTSPPPFETDNLKIGVAGFCWGAKHTVLLAQDDPATRVKRHETQVKSTEPEPLIDCAFIAHPSLLSVPDDIEPIKIPMSVAVGDVDAVLKEPEAKRIQKILEQKGGHEFNLLPGAKHGFAIRTHPDNDHEMECAEKAEKQAIDWFTKGFASTGS